jgi:hypothetical protein
MESSSAIVTNVEAFILHTFQIKETLARMNALTVTVSLCSMAFLMRSESNARAQCFALAALVAIFCCALVDSQMDFHSSTISATEITKHSQSQSGMAESSYLVNDTNKNNKNRLKMVRTTAATELEKAPAQNSNENTTNKHN